MAEVLQINPAYLLNVEKQLRGQYVTVRLPFTVDFEIDASNFGGANFGSFRIYNLGQDNRSQIRFDLGNVGQFRRVIFQAGYENDIVTIFDGNITSAWSVRQGVDFITQVDCLDGGFAFANSQSNRGPYKVGTPKQVIINDLLSDLNEIQFGAIALTPGSILKEQSYVGRTTDLLNTLTENKFTINNGKSYILGPDDTIDASVQVINARSGLLGTPVLQNTLVSVEMLFNPKIFMFQKVRLESLTADTNFNTFYKVIGLKHRGVISGTVGGPIITSLTLEPAGPIPVKQTYPGIGVLSAGGT
jgi:hypothetical protein